MWSFLSLDQNCMCSLCKKASQIHIISDAAYSKDTFADEVTEAFRAVTIQSMYSALNESRPQKEKDAIMDVLYRRMKSTIVDDPDKYSFNFDIILIHISKY